MAALSRRQSTSGNGRIAISPSYRLAALSIALKIVVARGWAASSSGQLSAVHHVRSTKETAGRRSTAFALPYQTFCSHAWTQKGTATVVERGSRGIGEASRKMQALLAPKGGSGGLFNRRQGTGSSFRCLMTTVEASHDGMDTGQDTRQQAVCQKASASEGGGRGRARVSYGSGDGKQLRLSKLLADRAVGTRTEVDKLIIQGHVKVDGATIRSPKKKLPIDCLIEVNGEACGPIPLLVAFHKPKGVITSMSDDWDREDLSKVLPKSLLLRHHPVGRLDGDSSGLLLFSSDGHLTHRLLSPRFNVEREYVATVEVPEAGKEPGEDLVEALKEGIETADGTYKADVPGIDGREVRIIVREGKHRMVRRMLANAGYPVIELRRERYGNIHLGDLAQGEHRPITGEVLEWAQAMCTAANTT